MKLVSIKYIVIIFILLLIDGYLRLIPDPRAKEQAFETRTVSLTKPSTHFPELVIWYTRNKEVEKDEIAEPVVDVVEQSIDESTQRGELHSVWINAIEYQLIAIFTGTKATEAVLLARDTVENKIERRVVRAGMQVDGYIIENITDYSVLINSPNDQQISLRLFDFEIGK